MKHELQFTGAALVVAIKGYFVEELVKLNSQIFWENVNYSGNYKPIDRDLVVQ